MRVIDRFSLIPSIEKGRRAVLQRRGRTPVGEVDGILLEAQFELDDGSQLIWLTDDSPYDEGLHVYLLGQDDIPEDSLEAGADFAGGIAIMFSAHRAPPILHPSSNVLRMTSYD